jgi:hypothetical protein
MNWESSVRALIIGSVSASLIGCTHVPAQIKSASARQAELLSAFDRSMTERDLAKGCNESFKAAIDMEAVLKKRGSEVQDRINNNFTDSKVRASAFQAKSAELAAKKEAAAMQTFIEQTTQLQIGIATLRADIETEKAKCAEAMTSVRDMVHSMSMAQAELDKFVQSDAKSPIEAFLFNLVETKTLSMKVDGAANRLQSKMGGVAEKLNQLENMFNAVKE